MLIFFHRIGGRVKDVPFGDVNIELGANWVQFLGSNKDFVNPIETLVNEANMTYINDTYSDFVFRYDGNVRTRLAKKVYKQLHKSEKKTLNMSKKIKSDISYRKALKLAEWNPNCTSTHHPVCRIKEAAEYFDFDFNV